MQSLQSLNGRFSGLFTSETESDEEGDGRTDSGFSRWGWMITLDNIADGDPSKYPYFYELNVIEFLTTISYKKAKIEEEKRLIEIQRLKNLANA